MNRSRQLCLELGLTLKLYVAICVVLALGVLFQWADPVAGEPISRAYDYQYGLISPWLHIHKTADLGSLHLLEALTADNNLGDPDKISWVAGGAYFWDALLLWVGIGVVKYLLRKTK